MSNPHRLRIAATLCGLALVILAGSWAESQAKSKKPKAPPPPPPAAMVSLSPRVIQEAAAYSAYVARTTAISPAFADGPSVAQSLGIGSAYEPNSLSRGAIAYGAVVALQDRAFMDGLKNYRTAAQRREIAYAVLRDPYYVTAFPGVDSAAGAVIAAVGGQGRAIYDQGKAVKQAAYDVQRSSWSKAEVADRAGRLQQVKTAATLPMSADGAETARLQQAISTRSAMTPVPTFASAAPPYTTLVTRALAVAALAGLGEGGDAAFDQVSALMVDPVGLSCLKSAKLNLNQCLAVSKPHYEDVFCLGEHVMMDTGRCLIKTAGGVMPPEPKKVLATTGKPYLKPAAKRPAAKRPAAKKK